MLVMTSRVTRNFDGPDALRVGKPSRHLPPAHLTFGESGEVSDTMRAQNLYEVRTHPERFEDWHVEMALDQAHALARRTGHLIADCARCRASWPVNPDADTCPLGHTIGG